MKYQTGSGVECTATDKGGRIMKRAIEKAMEAFPIVGDLHLRNAYISGYHQAEKDFADAFQAKYAKELARADLALTWEDMAKIDAIILDLNNEFAVDYSKKISRRKFYEEVLKRFNEQRKK